MVGYTYKNAWYLSLKFWLVLPFLVYFSAHSYVWRKVMDNFIGEIREMAVIEYEIPERGSSSDIVKIYLWNKGGYRVYIDDFTISIKEPRK